MRPPAMPHGNRKPEDSIWAAARGARVWVGGRNRSVKTILENRLPPTRRPPTGPLDMALIVPRSIDEAIYFADKVSSRLVPGGTLWVMVPCCPSEAGPPPADMLLAHAEAMGAAGWRVAKRSETDRDLTAIRLERIANPAPSIDPSRPDERGEPPAVPAPHIAK